MRDSKQIVPGTSLPATPSTLPGGPLSPAPSLLRRWLVPGLKILMAGGLVYYVLYHEMIDFKRLKELRLLSFLAAFGLISGQLLLGAQRLRLLLRPQGVHLRYTEMVRLTYLGAAFDVFLVTSVGGDAVKAVYLAREVPYGRRTEAVSVLVLDRLMGLLGLLSLTVMVGLWQVRLLWSDQTMRLGFIALIAIALGLLAGTMLLLSRRAYTSRLMQAGLRVLPFGAVIGRAYSALQQFRHQPRLLLQTWALSLVLHVLGVLGGLVLLYGLGLGEVTAGRFFAAWLVSNFICSFAAWSAIGVGQVTYEQVFLTLTGLSGAATLATAAQIIFVLAKSPGLVAWMISREGRKK